MDMKEYLLGIGLSGWTRRVFFTVRRPVPVTRLFPQITT